MVQIIYQPKAEPVLTAAQQAESITESRWHQPWSDPVATIRNRINVGIAVALIASGMAAISPTAETVPERISYDKWAYRWTDPPHYQRPRRLHEANQRAVFQDGFSPPPPPGAGKKPKVTGVYPDAAWDKSAQKPFRPIWDKPRGDEIEQHPQPQPDLPAGPPPLPPPSIFAQQGSELDPTTLPTFENLAPPDPHGLTKRMREMLDMSDVTDIADVIEALKALGLFQG